MNRKRTGGHRKATTDYRYGFNGQETDKEWRGGQAVSFRFRVSDSRIGKFLSVDPLSPEYPWYTPYQFAGNKVIQARELEGLEEKLSMAIDDVGDVVPNKDLNGLTVTATRLPKWIPPWERGRKLSWLGHKDMLGIQTQGNANYQEISGEKIGTFAAIAMGTALAGTMAYSFGISIKSTSLPASLRNFSFIRNSITWAGARSVQASSSIFNGMTQISSKLVQLNSMVFGKIGQGSSWAFGKIGQISSQSILKIGQGSSQVLSQTVKGLSNVKKGALWSMGRIGSASQKFNLGASKYFKATLGVRIIGATSDGLAQIMTLGSEGKNVATNFNLMGTASNLLFANPFLANGVGGAISLSAEGGFETDWGRGLHQGLIGLGTGKLNDLIPYNAMSSSISNGLGIFTGTFLNVSNNIYGGYIYPTVFNP